MKKKRINILVVSLSVVAFFLLFLLPILMTPWTSVSAQPVTPPETAPDNNYYEIVRTQQEDWGTMVTYVDKETRSGFLLTYDRNGLPIGMQPLLNVNGEPMRYDSEGNLLDRLLPEQEKIEVPVTYSREESIPFSISGSLSNVTGMLSSYGNGSKVGRTSYPEKEWITAYGTTTSNSCTAYNHARHYCNRPVSTRTIAGMVQYLGTCSGCYSCGAICDSASLTAKVIIKAETDSYTEWIVPRLWYESGYAPETADDGKIDSKDEKIEYMPNAERWLVK